MIQADLKGPNYVLLRLTFSVRANSGKNESEAKAQLKKIKHVKEIINFNINYGYTTLHFFKATAD